MIFNHFGGLHPDGTKFRIHVRLKNCKRHTFVDIPVSQNVTNLASRYIAKFLPDARTKGYISVMVRMERLMFKYSHVKPAQTQVKVSVLKCINNVVRVVHNLKLERNISSVFIATDTGKYGSYRNRVIREDRKKLVDLALWELHNGIFGEHIDFTSKIEFITPFLSPGYLAFLEKTVAANGSCIVLAGGGNFHKSVSNVYLKNLKNESETNVCLMTSINGC